MARTVFYTPSGEIYRISPYSSSQVRQLLAAGQEDRIDAAEEEFFEEILVDLKRLLGPRLQPAAATESGPSGYIAGGEQVVGVAPSGALVISRRSRRLGANEDGLMWLKQAFAGKLVFVLDAERRSHV